jgi:hypothetical protein
MVLKGVTNAVSIIRAVGRGKAVRQFLPILLILVPVAGCGQTGSPTVPTNRTAITTFARQGTDGFARRDMLAAMLVDAIGDVKINSMKEAIAAKQRAQRTLLAITTLNAEIRAGGIGDSQRAEKERKANSLRERYGRESRSLDAFYSALEHRGNELERILAFKDPEIERIDKELQRVYESNDKNKASEIARIRGEFERRSKELLAANAG